MDALISLALLFLFLFSGMLLARIPRIAASSLLKKLSGWILFGLLFFMGFRMGRTTEGSAELAQIGLLSLGFAVSTVAGTIAVLILLFIIFKEEKPALPDTAATADISYLKKMPVSGLSEGILLSKTAAPRQAVVILSHLKDPLKLFAFVVLGFFAGLLLPAGNITGAEISTWMLRALLLSIGMDLTTSGVNFRAVLSHKQTLLLPLGTAAGSLLGGLLMVPLFGLMPHQTLAVSAGFGWYSLSGVLITNMGDPFLGSAAFMSNILRETIALVTIPFVARSRFPHLAVGIGGATSMDVTLPLIERSCGAQTVPLAIASGAILSLLVPVLVPLFYNLG